MTPDFWKGRWETNQIGFHEGKPNALLTDLWPTLHIPQGARVFVPLCGKSLDMAWLAGEGHAVVGVELSEIAVRDFFAESGVTPSRETRDGFDISRAGSIEIWCGDFFALKPHHLAGIGAAYDRASLIAMPPELRPAYATKMLELVPRAAPMLLITLAYDQSEMTGPPFSVPIDEVESLYGATRTVTVLERRNALIAQSNSKVRGLSKAENIAIRLS